MMLYYIYSVVSWPWYYIYIYIIIYIIFHDVTISLQLSVVDPFPRVTGQELRPCPRRCCSLTGFYGGPPAAVLLLLLSFLLLPLSSLLVVTVHRPVLVNRPISPVDSVGVLPIFVVCTPGPLDVCGFKQWNFKYSQGFVLYINQCIFYHFFQVTPKFSHLWLNPLLFEHIPPSIALAIAREVLSDGLVELVGRRSVLGQLQLWQRLAVGTCAGRRMVQWWYRGSMTNKAVVTCVLLINPVN